MKLVELCQPLFQYVCLLNRSARKGVAYEMRAVRAEIDALLAEIASKAEFDPRLREQYPKIEPVLLFFVDGSIRESSLGFASEWKDLAHERNELEGDEKFFDLLDDTLREKGPAAEERLSVFYTCLGLGFAGWYAGRPDHLRKRMLEIAARLAGTDAGLPDPEDGSRIVPEAYEHTDTSNLIDPPGASLAGIGIALVGLVIVLFVTNIYLYRSNSRNLIEAQDGIIHATAGATGAVHGVEHGAEHASR